MAKVIITEDDEAKLSSIVGFLEEIGVARSDIVTARSLAEFSTKMSSDIDLCIIDVRIPAFEGGKADQNGQAILQILEGKGGKALMLAISSFPEEFESLRATFERRNCVLADFHQPDVWKGALKALVVQVSSRERFDFLVFVALPEERVPYLAIEGLNPKHVTRDGLNRVDITVNGRSGSLIVLPEMGIVDAAIIASKCIDQFSPNLVAMSGICAGFNGRAKLGQLLVSSMAYEYQSGKWTDDGFSQGPYQVPVSEKVRAIVREAFDEEDLISRIEATWRKDRPSSPSKPRLSVFTSGSAVIASDNVLAQIADTHRKVTGLDMEIFAVHRAALLSKFSPDVICAKVVVDLANSEKDDRIHEYGCYVSAQFVLNVIERYFRVYGE